ncbi:hypothetical protein [Pseudomonas sp. LB3P14]
MSANTLPGDLKDSIARATELFFETDRLESLAYSTLDTESKTEAVWKKFTAAKTLADVKRTEAYQDWMRLRRQKKH